MAGDSSLLPRPRPVCREAAFKSDWKSGAFCKPNHDVVVRPASSANPQTSALWQAFRAPHRQILAG